MQTTLKQQAAAIKKAMRQRELVLHFEWEEHFDFHKRSFMQPIKFKREHDKYWKALNDAYSTLIALQLNKSLSAAVS